jgi:Heavy metal associated domain 2
MLEYAHFVPGRLRLKLSELRDQQRAADAEADIAKMPGVIGVVANQATGSLTINFDKELSLDNLWESLQGAVTLRVVASSPPKSCILGWIALG